MTRDMFMMTHWLLLWIVFNKRETEPYHPRIVTRLLRKALQKILSLGSRHQNNHSNNNNNNHPYQAHTRMKTTLFLLQMRPDIPSPQKASKLTKLYDQAKM